MSQERKVISGDARRTEAVRILKSDRPQEYTDSREKRRLHFGFTASDSSESTKR